MTKNTPGGAKPRRVDSGLTEELRHLLQSYVRDVSELPNESAKRQRFASLVGACFPHSTAAQRIAAGAEHRLRIDLDVGSKSGSIDTYVGNAVIEFEKLLARTGAHAKEQLCEYVAGVWKEEGDERPLLAIATDGLEWELYRPVRRARRSSRVTAAEVELQHLRTLRVTQDVARLSEFWQWLTGLLFREESRPATAANLRFDFGAGSPAFANARAALERSWTSLAAEPEFKLKRTTWARYLAVTYGTLSEQSGEELDRLFLTHTYMAVLARFLVWAALVGKKAKLDFAQVIESVLTGDFFLSHKLENMVEDDFFAWISSERVVAELLPTWQRLLGQLLVYDVTHAAHQDLLKGLYQELVDPKDRHDLGEYYTPDWLCDALVEELVPAKAAARILDPTCGSGSFLRAAIARIRTTHPKSAPDELLHDILDRVAGIDIHPLAVTISKATYALALGPLLASARRPIRIPVYMADALFLPVEVDQLELGSGRTVEVRFGGEHSIHFPEELIQAPETFDASISACQSVALDHARSKKESRTSLAAYLRREVPTLKELDDPAAVEAALWQFTAALAELIRKRKDSIWGFIIRNAYRPAMLKGQFDVILGNPPWLAYRYIEAPDYQAEVKRRAVAEYFIAPKQQKLMAHMELATVFLIHSLQTFGADGARLAFVMPHSVWSADQHAPLREATYKAKVCVTGLWDLQGVTPLFNVPAGVVFAVREFPTREGHAELPLRTWEGRLKDHNSTWDEAKEELLVSDHVARRIYLGARSAWSDQPGASVPYTGSPYAKAFRQGATIVPRNCFFVTGDVPWPPESDAVYHVSTEERQAALSKPPYNEIRMSGDVEGAFLYRALLSRHVLPFVVLEPDIVVLPIVPTLQGSGEAVSRVLGADELRQRGFRRTAQWMKRVEGHWEEGRGEKDTQSIEERLDYQRMLRCQPAHARWVVLYNAAGQHLCSAVFDHAAAYGRLVVDAKLYWYATDNADEAHYLAAILNADVINKAVKPFQSLGLLGERDIHKKVLELPFPSYQRGEKPHAQLAKLGEEAAQLARSGIKTYESKGSLGAGRSAVREGLQETLYKINTLVKSLLES